MDIDVLVATFMQAFFDALSAFIVGLVDFATSGPLDEILAQIAALLGL